MFLVLNIAHYCCRPDAVTVDEAEEQKTGGGQDPDRVLRWITLREEGFENVEGEGEALNGADTGPQDDAFYPEPDEGEEGSKGEVDVGIICSRLLDHTAKLSVTIGPYKKYCVSFQK